MAEAVSPTTMRLHLTITILVVASILTACATRKVAHVEVTPALVCVTSDNGVHHVRTFRYAPFVVSQGDGFTIDFVDHDSFASPQSGKREPYWDGVVTSMTVTISNTSACFSGRSDYQFHLGVTASYEEENKSLYGQTLRTYSTRFSGTSTLGHEMRVGAGEDINDEPVVCFTFRQTTEPLKQFNPEFLDFSETNRSPASTLTTPSYKITVEERCPERFVTCDDVKYIGVNRKSGKSITLIGRTVHTTGADGVTPSRFLGYEFKNGRTTYFIGEDGELRVTRGSKVLVEEAGVWNWEQPSNSPQRTAPALGKSDGSDNLSAIVAAERAFPAAVSEFDR